MRKIVLLSLILLNVTPFATGQTQAVSAESGEVLRLDEARFVAMTRADIAELNKILADDLVYTHSSGRVETKKEFIASLETGSLKYVSIQNEEKKARIYGTTALINGRAKVTISSQGQEQSFVLRYLDVYVKRNNKWQMVAWQSTRLP
jgi:ketosteroid isomerase-like protein